MSWPSGTGPRDSSRAGGAGAEAATPEPGWLRSRVWVDFEVAARAREVARRTWPPFGPADEREVWREHVVVRGGEGPKPVRLLSGEWIIPGWPPDGQALPPPLTREEWESSREWIAWCMGAPIVTPGSSAKRAKLTEADRRRIAERQKARTRKKAKGA